MIAARAATLVLACTLCGAVAAQPKSSAVPTGPGIGGGLTTPTPTPTPPPPPPTGVPTPPPPPAPGGTTAPAPSGVTVLPPAGGGAAAAPPGVTTPQPPPPDVAPPAAALPRAPDAEPGELLVAWSSAPEADAGVAEIATRYGARPTARIALPALGRVVDTYVLRSHAEAVALRASLARDRPQWRADFNALYEPLADARRYAAAQIDLPEDDGRVTAGGIGMLDGPVAAIAALAGSAVVRKSFLPAGVAPARDGHGTAIAMLIAGVDPATAFRGAAPGAPLFAGEVMRTHGPRDDTNVRLLLAGLDWLLAEKARVVNLSLGGAHNRLLLDAIATLLAHGTVVVAAAGNGGANAPPAYPAAYPGVIAVTANDAHGRVYAHANRGGYIAVSAPGVDVWVPDRDGGQYVSGTSYAAAWVTGAAARLAGATPGIRPTAVRQELCAAARDLGAPGRDPVFGCGLLQVRRALERVTVR